MSPGASPASVDAVIPAYGEPEHLAPAIESVLSQTSDSWRLRVVNNGPAGSAAAKTVAPYLDDARVELLTTEEVLPAHQSWTRCIQEGDAPYVAMLHDDDTWDPEYLERRMEFMDMHPECGFVFSSWREIDADGEEIEPVPHRLSEGVHQRVEFVPRLFESMIVGSPTIMVRRKAYRAVGAQFTDRLVNFDWEMWMRIAVRYPVGYLAVRDCGRRLHPRSQTAANRGWGAEELRILDNFEPLVQRELPAVRLPLRPRRRRRGAAHLMSALDALEEGQGRKARSHLREAVRTYPASVLDARFGATALALALGARGREWVTRLRRRQSTRRRPIHLRDYGARTRDAWLRLRRG